MLVNLEPYWKIFAILLDVNPTTFVFEGIIPLFQNNYF